MDASWWPWTCTTWVPGVRGQQPWWRWTATPTLAQAVALGSVRDALGVAFGLRAGAAPDRFLVGLAVLSLLSEVAGERPLLCVVDDAQWLDRAQALALAFAARRLLAEPIALIFATREPSEEFAGMPEHVVRGLETTP